MSVLRAIRAALLVYATGLAVALRQLLRRFRGGFPESALPAQPGRVAIVTGGTDGIGLRVARRLAGLRMRVVLAGNDAAKAPEVVAWIRAETGNEDVRFLFCDLGSTASVRGFTREFAALGLPLHVLVNNAGVMLVPHGETADGFELHAGVNFLGHFLLTRLLLPLLLHSGEPGRAARVVTVGSATHYVGELDLADVTRCRPGVYSPHEAYAGSKLALVTFTLRLQRLLDARGDPVTANVADPGVVDTDLYRHAGWGVRVAQRLFGRLLFKTPDEGAWTTVFAAAAPELEGVGGRYLAGDGGAVEPLAVARDPNAQRRLWAEASRATGVGAEL